MAMSVIRLPCLTMVTQVSKRLTRTRTPTSQHPQEAFAQEAPRMPRVVGTGETPHVGGALC